ncbi:hypothetical protein Gohar_002971, partial [Gossypium harknessii]|nr:hypothetical protein [Gossypium harknessii]
LENDIEKTLKKIQNSTGRTESSDDTTLGSTDTTQTSISRTHSSKQGSFGLGLLSTPWSDLPIQPKTYTDRTSPTVIFWKDFYRYKFPSTDTTKLQFAFNAGFYSCNDSILFLMATYVHKVVRGLKYKVKAPH